MEISVYPELNDASIKLFVGARVFLDGIEQRGVITANEELGFIERVVMTSTGNIDLSLVGEDGTIPTEIVRGTVRIELPPPTLD